MFCFLLRGGRSHLRVLFVDKTCYTQYTPRRLFFCRAGKGPFSSAVAESIVLLPVDNAHVGVVEAAVATSRQHPRFGVFVPERINFSSAVQQLNQFKVM